MKQLSFFDTVTGSIYIGNQNYSYKNKLRVISLFCGCGGMDLGFQGDFTYLNKYYPTNPYEIIFENDIIKKACDTYSYNFHREPLCCDIKNIDTSILPDADIVIGGFPCQDFSLAGKRKGLDTERGQLYLEMKRVIDCIKPLAFVAENVDGIRISKSKSSPSALDIILNDFSKSGYQVVFKALNAADYGVPQNRTRIIIVGIRNDLHKKMIFPSPTHGIKYKFPILTAKQAIDDIWEKLGDTSIPNHTFKDYSKAKFYPGKKSQGNNKIKADAPAPTIRSEHHGNIEAHYRSLNGCSDPNDMTYWRRLSIRECARLQSFPDDFVFPVAASEAYKQIGNAVPPVLAWNIANALYNSLDN